MLELFPPEDYPHLVLIILPLAEPLQRLLRALN